LKLKERKETEAKRGSEGVVIRFHKWNGTSISELARECDRTDEKVKKEED